MKKQYISPNGSVYNLKLEGGMLCLSGINNVNNGTVIGSEDLNSSDGAWTNKKDTPAWEDTEEGTGYW